MPLVDNAITMLNHSTHPTHCVLSMQGNRYFDIYFDTYGSPSPPLEVLTTDRERVLALGADASTTKTSALPTQIP